MIFNKIYAILKLIRINNLFIASVCCLTYTYILNEIQNDNLFYILGTIIFLGSGGNIINDVFDIKIDLINRPQRILPKKIITLKEAKIYSFIFFALGLSCTFFLPITSQLIACIYVMPALILYSPVFKNKPLIGNVIIASILGSVFLFTESALKGHIINAWLIFFFAFGISFLRELIKDMEDYIGDKKNNIFTFPVLYGLKKSKYLYIFLASFFIVFTIFPIFLKPNIYTINYLISLIIIIHIPIIITLKLIINNNNKSYPIISLILKISTLSGLIVLLTI